MALAARQHKPIVLVSDGLEQAQWDAAGEDERVSRLAVCQDIWGRNCFAPGQAFAMRQAAYALALNKSQIFGALGINMGGFGLVTQEYGTHIEVFEGDEALFQHNRVCQSYLGKLIKLDRWTAGKPTLKVNRYHRLSTFGAFAAVEEPGPLALELAAALKPGGYLYIDEIWSDDAQTAARTAVMASLWQTNLKYQPKPKIISLLADQLELRSTNEANRLVKGDIRAGLVQAQEIAKTLKTIPEPFRKQRLVALTLELQRAVVLYDALERGTAVATRFVFHKKAEIK